MRKQILFLIAALTMLICGNSQAQDAYKFPEPKDSVAKIIWEKLKTEDEQISRLIAAINKTSKTNYTKAEYYQSKTALEFVVDSLYECDKSSDEFEDYDKYWEYYKSYYEKTYDGKYQMQCYQKKDGSWIAVINYNIFSSDIEDENWGTGLKVVQYKKGKLSYPKAEKILPKNYIWVFDKYFLSINYSDTEINFYDHEFSPVKMVWNGNKFTTNSIIGTSNIEHDCGFITYLTYDRYELGTKWTGEPDGILYEDKDKKNAVVKFDIKDSIIQGYTILNPGYGFAMEFDKNIHIAALPVTIGSPMQYVLKIIGNTQTYERLLTHYMNITFQDYSDKDYPKPTKEYKDGKFVVTIQLEHDTQYDWRDSFIEITSKDENSPIEKIRVYYTPLNVTLMGEIENCKILSENSKTIFKALNFNEKEYGKFRSFDVYAEEDNELVNGFYITFVPETCNPQDKDWISGGDNEVSVKFQRYQADNKNLVILSKYSNEIIENKFWIYENGNLTPTEVKLPEIGDDYFYNFNEEGLKYYQKTDLSKGSKLFHWDGKEFVEAE